MLWLEVAKILNHVSKVLKRKFKASKTHSGDGQLLKMSTCVNDHPCLYYSDPEAECQAFHVCAADGRGGLAKYSFLCPNGTLFSQEYFICDWWFNFDCAEAENLYR